MNNGRIGWVKTILYLGLAYLTGIIIILLLIILDLKKPVEQEIHVLTGLALFTIVVSGLSTIYYVFAGRTSEEGKASPSLIRYTGIIGSLLIAFSSLYIVYLYQLFNISQLCFYASNILMYLGFILLIYSLYKWVIIAGERKIAYTVKLGIVFPTTFLTLYLISIVLYYFVFMENISVYVFGVKILVTGIVFSLLITLIGLETLISHRESYLLGSLYTIASLIVVIYIVQMLTTITTTSILAEKINTYRNTSLPLTIESGDKIGLMIISYKIYLSLILLYSIIYLVAILVLVRRKDLEQSIGGG